MAKSVRQLAGKRVTVVGLGRSGVAAVRLLLREGAIVTATDLRSERSLAALVEELSPQGVRFELDGHRMEAFVEAELIVKSPGIRPSVPELAAAAARGVEIIGEVELAAPYLDAPVAAITGTNGKSTTTALLGHLLETAGLSVFTGGNLGVPVAEYVLRNERVDALVLELSSYQIDDLATFECDVGCVTNVTPDHLERYGAFDAYVASKARLLSMVRPQGVTILNAGNGPTREMATLARTRVAFFGEGPVVEGEVRSHGGQITDAFTNGGGEYHLGAPALRGVHNAENAMCAIIAARAFGASPELIQKGLDSYPGLPHRIESVRVLDGVEWINDSKATNVDSVEKSLVAFKGPVHLIMGGRGKGASYAPLRSLFPGRVARLYLIGEESARIGSELGDLVPSEDAGDLETAVILARGFARPGAVVLLSPACSSFDQFESFEERGQTFRALVERLTEGT